ncbi:ParB/RepB/Spo0J family partition protein [Nitrospirillum viridazoti]|uniref:Chromosome segregation DNA-binding protein n=1 Tax=Nitrospirillum amazonense TaxID=28077 RepID=A0A560HXS7_9PROT|nr:ParB/RepB/Spo0J family partition protein [Nitrospirillum amazonense]TWB51457.1 chromosome segregation DNA-binding protein [Nitrospirillum amazonense]
MSRKLARSNPALAATAASLLPATAKPLNKLYGTSEDFPELVELDLDQVFPNPDQPRRHFDETALRELADSIGAQGLIQPIVVRKRAEGGYLIAAGERRWRAHRLLGKATIFAIVTQGGVDEIALIENLQRQDLDTLEVAWGLSRLGETHRYTQDQLAGAVGLSKSEVSRLLALVRLPDSILAEYPEYRDQVSKSHLFILADAEDDAARHRLWGLIKGGATIKALRAANKPAEPAVTAPKAAPAAGHLITRMERDLAQVSAGPNGLAAKDRERLEKLRQRLDEILR